MFRGVHKKPTYSEHCLKGGAWTVCRFKRGLSDKEGVMFLSGVDTLIQTMFTTSTSTLICYLDKFGIISKKEDYFTKVSHISDKNPRFQCFSRIH